MTPVLILSDGFIANGAEPWRIPEISDLPKIEIKEPRQLEEGETFLPYERDDKLARPWAAPGLPGHAHRLGGIEKAKNTGNVSYDPENHQEMTEIRAAKVANIAKDIPLQEVHGPDSGDLLVLSWGGTYGSCLTAVEAAQKAGKKVAHTHLRYINPFPSNLGELLKRYDKVLMPELNMGQLRLLIRAEFLVDAIGLNKVQGKPFPVSEVLEKINEILA